MAVVPAAKVAVATAGRVLAPIADMPEEAIADRVEVTTVAQDGRHIDH
jgi:hypothetical protein